MARQTIVSRFLLGAICGVVALSTSGCFMKARNGYLETPPRAEAKLVQYSHYVRIEGEGATMATQEHQAALEFLDQIGLRATDSVEIHAATGAGAPDHAPQALADLQDAFEKGGVPSGLVRVVEDENARDGFEVVVHRYVVLVPDCVDVFERAAKSPWSDRTAQRELGCTNERNLALMVADPGDLAGAREAGPAYGIREGMAVERYRNDEIKDIKIEIDTVGNTE